MTPQEQREYVSEHMDADMQFVVSEAGVSLGNQVAIARYYGSLRKFGALADDRGQWKDHGDQRKDAADGHSNIHLPDHRISGICQEVGAMGPSGPTSYITGSDSTTKAEEHTKDSGCSTTTPGDSGEVRARDQERLEASISAMKSGKGYSKQIVKLEAGEP